MKSIRYLIYLIIAAVLLSMSATPSLRNYTAYNQAMKEMCERDDLTYVDTSILISASSTYEFDGLHPQEPFYSDWLDLMVMCLQKKEAES